MRQSKVSASKSLFCLYGRRVECDGDDGGLGRVNDKTKVPVFT